MTGERRKRWWQEVSEGIKEEVISERGVKEEDRRIVSKTSETCTKTS